MKKLFVRLLTMLLAVATLTACSSGGSTSELETIKIAASPTPHAEILEYAKAALKEKGYDLQVTEFEDYVQPNEVVEAGDLDANYFQHVAYLNNFNEEHGTHLVNAGSIHYEPYGIYAGTKSKLEELAKGDVIAVPNDTTNEARALLLLQANGILKLKKGVGLEATVKDIESNPKGITFKELEAAQVSRVKDEVAFVILNGNYALDAGYNAATDAIAYEEQTSEAGTVYANVIAVKEGNENEDKIKALVEVLKSEDVRKYIEDTFKGAVVPVD
ncbi:MAG: MetQ/NlpA family ABC transporter substrate-binding protein [Erysipelotrichaceae bacterium]|nr:MetQ/NlpA family ABC transporter substrate-binding protein [Erysipelotrichaceae bacterium]